MIDHIPCNDCGQPATRFLPDDYNEEQGLWLCDRCYTKEVNTCPCGCDDPFDPTQCVYARQAQIDKEKQTK